MKILVELYICGGFRITQDERPSTLIVQYWVAFEKGDGRWTEVDRQTYMDCLETAKFGERFDAAGALDGRLEKIQGEIEYIQRTISERDR